MKGKKPLAFLLIAVLAIGMVGAFAASPVAAQDNDENSNECNAEASNEANQAQNAVGAYIDQDQLADQDAAAAINNDAFVEQANYQHSEQAATGANVAQSADLDASNTAVVSQCEANADQ